MELRDPDGVILDQNGLARTVEEVAVHRLTASRRWTGCALKLMAGLGIGAYADWNMNVLPAVTTVVETGVVVAAVRRERHMMRKTDIIRGAASEYPHMLLDAAKDVGATTDTEMRDGVLRLVDECLVYAEAEIMLRKNDADVTLRDAQGYPLLLSMRDDAIDQHPCSAKRACRIPPMWPRCTRN